VNDSAAHLVVFLLYTSCFRQSHGAIDEASTHKPSFFFRACISASVSTLLSGA